MRALLSTIGSRGDVQPLVALALVLRELGHEVRICAPPDFREWIEGLGIRVTPIGPELRGTARASTATPFVPTPEQRRKMMEATVAMQFETIAEAAEGCDVIVGATALQIAGPSIAESIGVPYVFAAYCPAVLPSAYHAPPVLTALGDRPAPATADHPRLWAEERLRWREIRAPTLDARRRALGLAPVDDVLGHVLTERPWLAADPTLAPWPDGANGTVFQTGAWILSDDRPLAPALEAFLDAGDPPVYFGFGSVRAPERFGETAVRAARALGLRAIVSRGWAELALPADDADCLLVDEVNQQLLFPRVAAVVHHGGAGTTTAAAGAGVPQVVIPQVYDQHYWAHRVEEIGLGTAITSAAPDLDALTAALDRVVRPEVLDRARAVSAGVRADGARVAAERLVAIASGG